MPIDYAPPPPTEDDNPPASALAALETLHFVAHWESFVDHVYWDEGHLPTIGHGFLLTKGTPLWDRFMRPDGQAKFGLKLPVAESLSMLNARLAGCESDVRHALNHAPLDHQFTALVSLCYNIGTHEFLNSTLVDCYNAHQLDRCPAQFMRWVFVKGKLSNGLVNRRKAEAALFKGGV